MALTLIQAGGAGNLVDRLSDGYVVDFLFVGVGHVHTGIFNVVDVWVMAGVVGLLVASVCRRTAHASTRS